MLQKIIIYTRLDDTDKSLILAGIRLTTIFRKELCLLCEVKGEYNLDIIDGRLRKYQEWLHGKVPAIPVSILILPHKGEKIASLLADEYEAIMLIAESSMFRKLSYALRNSPIPFLFVSGESEKVPDFQKVVFPVDLRLQNKDAIKWILYFGKHNHSDIIAIGANDRFKSDRQQVASHMISLRKVLTKAGVKHAIYKGSRSSFGIHREGLEAAFQMEAGLMVLLGSSAVTLLDLVLGLPEQKIIREGKGLPILIVNPRRETYLVCE